LSSIKNYLSEIAIEALKLKIDLESCMFPGATQAYIGSVAKDLPFELPVGILELYYWKNGAKLEARKGETRFFPGFQFLPFERSVMDTRLFLSALPAAEIFWRKSWFSLCSDLAGYYYAVDAGHSDGTFGVVYSIQDLIEPFPAFSSFDAMLHSILECYRAGAYYLDEDGYLEDDEKRCDDIYKKYNNGLSPYSRD
jgi:cell wall assembly regulator SMI1